jgi:hypothetical protein
VNQVSNIFEEMRADRAQRAQIRRADRAAEWEQNRADRREKQDRADRRRDRRQARRVAVLRWLAGHPVYLLMVVIIVVPALLAWTAMAVYGRELYGLVGVLLPLFTEAAMWAFAFKLHAARRAAHPTGWLLVGTWTFTAVAAGLNYVHGQVQGGWSVGVVMAVVSTGGVIAHQIITAAPMRPRLTRTERAMARRVSRMQRAAVRHAVGELAADGTIRLLYRPGVVALRRGWHLRTHLVHTGIPGMADDGPADRSLADSLGAEAQAWLAEQDHTGSPPSIDPDGTRSIQGRSIPDRPVPESTGDQHKSTRNRGVIPEPARRSIDELRTELRAAVEQALPLDQGRPIDPSNAESIRRALRCAPKTARLLRDEWNDGTAGLLVG